jgi:hypothetical protein
MGRLIEMSKRNIVLVGLVAFMLAVVAVGYCMHANRAVPTGSENPFGGSALGAAQVGPKPGNNQ